MTKTYCSRSQKMLLFGDTPNEGELCMLWPPDVPFEAFLRRATEEGSEWWSEIYWSATVNQTLCLKRADIWSTAQNRIYKRISGSYAVVKDWSSGTKKNVTWIGLWWSDVTKRGWFDRLITPKLHWKVNQCMVRWKWEEWFSSVWQKREKIDNKKQRDKQ